MGLERENPPGHDRREQGLLGRPSVASQQERFCLVVFKSDVSFQQS
jgi:hypothetical protein